VRSLFNVTKHWYSRQNEEVGQIAPTSILWTKEFKGACLRESSWFSRLQTPLNQIRLRATIIITAFCRFYSKFNLATVDIVGSDTFCHYGDENLQDEGRPGLLFPWIWWSK
jgi:hypothetical protein